MCRAEIDDVPIEESRLKYKWSNGHTEAQLLEWDRSMNLPCWCEVEYRARNWKENDVTPVTVRSVTLKLCEFNVKGSDREKWQ